MERCSRCGQAKNSGEQGRITQWVAGCKCDMQPLATDESEQLLFCSNCNLRIVERKAGRLTQWIFSSHQCQCSEPKPTTVAPHNTPPPVVSYRERKTIEQEREIPVDQNSFPLDRYKPLKAIGTGAEGLVYLSRDRLLKKKVAIKCLKSLTNDHLVSLQREAKAISHLQHPNIITVLDFGTVNGAAPYMVLDYVRGTSLENIIRETGPLPVDAAVEVIKQTASGLAHAHNKGIFHRDIKSANILVVDRSQEDTGSQDLRIKIIDFGLATATHLYQEPTILHGRTIVGTPAYMPPDQALGYSYDERSEMYALGCVFFEALTGVPPYKGDTALATINMHANLPTPALCERNENIFYPPALEKIISKCLAKDREERFQSMEELIDALNAMNTRRVMTAEVYKPVLTTTGGFTLPEDSTIEDPHSFDAEQTKSFFSSPTLYGSVIAIAFLAFAAFAWIVLGNADSHDGAAQTKVVERKKKHHSGKVEALAPGIVKITNGTDRDVSNKSKWDDVTVIEFHKGKYSKKTLEKLAVLPSLITLVFDDTSFEQTESDPKAIPSFPNLSSLKISKNDDTALLFIESADKLNALKKLDLSNVSLSTEQFSRLQNFKNLEELRLSALTNFSGAGLKYLEGLPLQTLELSYMSALSDKSISHLKGLNQLRQLIITNCPEIQGNSFSELKDLQIRELRLAGLPLTQLGFESIAKIKTLEQLTTELMPQTGDSKDMNEQDLACTRATFYSYEPGSFKDLKNLPALNSLLVNANLFYPGAAEELGELTKLTELDLLALEHVPASTFTKLGRMPNLKNIVLFGPGADVRGWVEIGRIKNLKNLSVLRSDIDDDEIEALTGSAFHFVALDSRNITDTGFKKLAGIKTLKTVEYECPEVSEETIREMKSTIPGATIRQGCKYRSYTPAGPWALEYN